MPAFGGPAPDDAPAQGKRLVPRQRRRGGLRGVRRPLGEDRKPFQLAVGGVNPAQRRPQPGGDGLPVGSRFARPASPSFQQGNRPGDLRATAFAGKAFPTANGDKIRDPPPEKPDQGGQEDAGGRPRRMPQGPVGEEFKDLLAQRAFWLENPVAWGWFNHQPLPVGKQHLRPEVQVG